MFAVVVERRVERAVWVVAGDGGGLGGEELVGVVVAGHDDLAVVGLDHHRRVERVVLEGGGDDAGMVGAERAVEGSIQIVAYDLEPAAGCDAGDDGLTVGLHRHVVRDAGARRGRVAGAEERGIEGPAGEEHSGVEGLATKAGTGT